MKDLDFMTFPSYGKSMILTVMDEFADALRRSAQFNLYAPVPPDPDAEISHLQRKAQRGDRQAQRDLALAQKKRAAELLTQKMASQVKEGKANRAKKEAAEQNPDWGMF